MWCSRSIKQKMEAKYLRFVYKCSIWVHVTFKHWFYVGVFLYFVLFLCVWHLVSGLLLTSSLILKLVLTTWISRLRTERRCSVMKICWSVSQTRVSPRYNFIVTEINMFKKQQQDLHSYWWDLKSVISVTDMLHLHCKKKRHNSPAVLGRPLWPSWLSASSLGSTGWTGSPSSASTVSPGVKGQRARLLEGP